jgi:hypothetical protein
MTGRSTPFAFNPKKSSMIRASQRLTKRKCESMVKENRSPRQRFCKHRRAQFAPRLNR